MKLKKPELLVPAGNLTRLKTAILYGADSVYVGSPSMSLRSKSGFSLDDIKEGAKLIAKHNKKLYLALNIFSHNSDVEKLPAFLELIEEIKPSGILVADPGIFMYLKQHAPEYPLHISTQANICSWISVDFWHKQGASLCVLARETSFDELTEIKQKCPDIKLETFIHGSMCMTYSGRCLLSNFMAERGANQGSCAHSCRWNYNLKVGLDTEKIFQLKLNDENREIFKFVLEEEFREGEFYPIEEDAGGSYILNSKDLCLMPVLKDYINLGIDTLKIEGRNKSEYYVATVTRAYRKAIDDYFDSCKWNESEYMNELYTISNRGYTTAFHSGRLTDLAHNYDSSKSISNHAFAGVILEHVYDGLIFEVRNYLIAGDVLEFVAPKIATSSEQSFINIRLRMYEFINSDNLTVLNKVSGGSGNHKIKIPYTLFNNENIADLRQVLPPLSIARKFNPDRSKYRSLIRYQKTSLSKEVLESADTTQSNSSKVNEYNESIKVFKDRVKKEGIDNKSINAKKPILGDKGCCYKGCNGCLIFWDKTSDQTLINLQEKYSKL